LATSGLLRFTTCPRPKGAKGAQKLSRGWPKGISMRTTEGQGQGTLNGDKLDRVAFVAGNERGKYYFGG